jgi:glycosyltransferase involved in cell wall biosynthesis/O-antigen/teichoic acid export membrane protein
MIPEMILDRSNDTSNAASSFAGLGPISALRKRMLSSQTSLILIDQGVVSAGNFLTALVLARILAPISYGTFSLLFLALFGINTVHSSLVIYPLTLRGATLGAEDSGSLTGLALLHTTLLAIPLAAVLGVVAFAVRRPDLIFPLVLAMLAWQLQETSRRALLATSRPGETILPDGLCYLGQAIVLLLLRPQNLTMIFYIVAATSVLATIWQALVLRVHLHADVRQQCLEYGSHCWRLGRYILAGNVLNMFSLQLPSWILAMSFGPLGVAGYQSLLNLVGVANPIIFSANSLLIPAVVRAAPHGVSVARRTAMRYGTQYGLLLVPGFLLLLLAPSFVMHHAYGEHTSYGALAPLLRPFVIAFVIQYLATVIGAYEGGMSRPKTYMWVQIASTAIILGVGIPLIMRWGIRGAVYTMLAASLARLCAFAAMAQSNDRRILEEASAKMKVASTTPSEKWVSLKANPIAVSVCVLTYRRMDQLRLTLESLRAQTLLGSAAISMSILVIDNDDAQSARHIVEHQQSLSDLQIRYIASPLNGLSTARNLALEHSRLADFVAFIDDDEVAHPDWLARLIHTAIEFEADVVSGPVLPNFQDAPAWVIRGGFFNAIKQKSGLVVRHVATSNTLIHAKVFRTIRFNLFFDTTGGEDTDFFLRVAQEGFRMVWCDEARVLESVPARRANLRWILARAYSDASRFTTCTVLIERSLQARVTRFAKSLGGIVVGCAWLPVGVLGGHHAARGLQLIARAAGTLSALRGRSVQYYGSTSESTSKWKTAPTGLNSESKSGEQNPLTVAIVGQVPPPMNGQALMIQQFLEGNYPGLALLHVPMSFSRSNKELGRMSLRKVWILAETLVRIIGARIQGGATVLYYPPAGANLNPVVRDIVLLSIGRLFFRKTVFHFHATGLGEIYKRLPFALKPFYRLAYGHPDLVIFTTKATSADATHLGAKNLAIVPCGVPDGVRDGARPMECDRLSMRSEIPVVPTILFAGILCEGKGVHTLLEACRVLRAHNIEFRTELLGEFQTPQFEQEMRRFVSDSNLSQNVTFPGVVLGEAKARAFQSASIFCFPSHYAAETFGVVLIEAMSYSLPIVATDWQGIPEVTGRNGQGTLLVPIRDADALAESLKRLLGNSALRTQMGEHNRDRYLANFTVACYREALASSLLTLS